MYPYPRPFKRPDFYPHSILWTLDDCKNDPTVTTSSMNKSRPSMKRALRHDDGRYLTDAEWKTICRSAVLISRTILEPLDPLGTVACGQPQKKKFYQNNFPNDWIQAMQELEILAPVTSYCVGTYKAELTPGSILQDNTSPNTAPAPSRSSTPSSLAPSRIASSSVAPSSNMAPPSTVPSRPGSSRVPVAPCSGSATSASNTSCQSPRRAAPKPAQLCASSEVQQADLGPLSATGSKAKRRRDPSPLPQRKEKRSRGCEDSHSSTSPGMLPSLCLCRTNYM